MNKKLNWVFNAARKSYYNCLIHLFSYCPTVLSQTLFSLLKPSTFPIPSIFLDNNSASGITAKIHTRKYWQSAYSIYSYMTTCIQMSKFLPFMRNELLIYLFDVHCPICILGCFFSSLPRHLPQDYSPFCIIKTSPWLNISVSTETYIFKNDFYLK